MNTAKLVNSALTGGGLIYPENLNIVIGSENKGYPKGYVLDANATLSLAGQASSGSTQQGGSQQNDPLFKNMYTYNTNLRRGFQISYDDQGRYSNNLIIGDIKKGQFNGNSLGYSNILQGDGIISVKNENILTGNYIVSNGYYNHIISSSNFAEPTYTKIDDNNIIVTVDKNSDDYNLIKNSRILLLYAEAKDDNILISDRPSGGIAKIDYTVTDINDTQVKLTSPDIKKLINTQTNKLPFFSIYNHGDANLINGYSIVNYGSRSIMSGSSINVEKVFNASAFGYGINITNNSEVGVGAYNVSKALTGKDRYVFTVGAGDYNERKNAIEVRRNGKVYIQDIGGFNGHNSDQSDVKTLQQVISDIETAVSLNSNGPWDVDITSEFVNGNVTIKPLSMWSITQGVKRVYFLADLKQGDVITIPDTLRMYIGWKISDNRFGMADWNTAGKKYTVTTDSKYVVLLDTPTADAPGVQTNTLPSFGKIMLRTSNPEFKPTLQTDAKKDHTNDDKVMRGIAHQGFHKLERANSLAAFRAAAKEGWRYVETDTYMTSDGKFIVSHDPYLPVGWTDGATTTTQGSYKYEEHTLAEILAFHGPNNEKTDTLEEFCKTCKECGLHPYIELKQGKMADTNTLDTNPRYNGKGYGVKVLDIVNRYGLRGNATFIASVPFTLLRMAREDQSYRYGIVYFGQLKNSDTAWATVLSKIDEYNNDAVASKAYLFLDANINNLKVADADAVDKLVQKNCALEVWTATTKDDLNNLDPYVTGVTSDNIHAGEILAKKI